MKKAFTIFFLLLYIVLNVGLNIMIHTCGGESEALLATTSAEDPCGCADDMDPADMCCTTEITTVKLEDAQKGSVVPIIQKLIVVDVLSTETGSPDPFQISSFQFETLIRFSPPPNKDFQSSNSVFLI